MTDLISKKTRNEFREHLVRSSTLRPIAMEFDAADIACATDYVPSEGGERRSLVEQYYKTLDFGNPRDVRKLLRVYANVLSRLEDVLKYPGGSSPFGTNLDAVRQTFDQLVKWLRMDGYLYQDGVISSAAATTPVLDDLQAAAAVVDATYIKTQIDRMNAAVEADPCLAIGTAKELIETTCKTILAECDVDVDRSADVGDLIRMTREALALAPEGVSEDNRAAPTIKKLLGSLGAIAHTLAELRNAYGTGHGPEGRTTGLQPRHARLAVGAAATLATFLFETHVARARGQARAASKTS